VGARHDSEVARHRHHLAALWPRHRHARCVSVASAQFLRFRGSFPMGPVEASRVAKFVEHGRSCAVVEQCWAALAAAVSRCRCGAPRGKPAAQLAAALCPAAHCLHTSCLPSATSCRPAVAWLLPAWPRGAGMHLIWRRPLSWRRSLPRRHSGRRRSPT
jgi:hypothetical protein